MIRRDYDNFDIIAIPILIASIRKYVLTVQNEIIAIILNNNEYMVSQMLSNMTLSQRMEWETYQKQLELIIKKQFITYINKINVSLYYASSTNYDIIKSEVVGRFYRKDSNNVRGLSGQIVRTYTTEYTRTSSLLTDYDYINMPNLEKQWVYTYESKTRRIHHHAHDGVVSVNGNFIVDGLVTRGPGLFGVPSQDMNCRCRVKLVDEPYKRNS